MRIKELMIFTAVAAWTFLVPSRSWAQDDKDWKFPSELRSALESRVRSFTRAQAQGRWNDVANLLGKYRRGFSDYMPYTATHKACLISQMQTSPMIDFTFTVQEVPFSSEIYFTPPSRKWWTLVGEGVFREASRPVKRQISLTAYRDRGNWYFTPPPFDNANIPSKVTKEELAADLKDRVHLALPGDCPLDVVDLHLHIDARNPSSRVIELRLRNKTAKRVTGYELVMSDEGREGSFEIATGAPEDAIDPQGVSRKWQDSYAAYTYWCEGEAPIIIEIQLVTFADGSAWSNQGSQTSP